MTIIYDKKANMYISDVLVNQSNGDRTAVTVILTSSPANAMRFEKKDADLVKQISGTNDVDLIELEDEECPEKA